MIKDILEQLKSKVDFNKEDSLSNEDTNSPITKLTTEKLKAIIADLNNAGSIFSDAGFTMEQLEVEVGLLPKITPQFLQTKKIDKEKERELLDDLNDKKLLQFILQSLFKSSRMEALMENTELSLYGIEIEISVPPSVRTIFKKSSVVDNSSNIEPMDRTTH